ncbi:hypothetical protein BVY03_02135 [bacterium K02(2017)]|nr:hypothetical protein BVY03_02135 [bacterium K02(2017)]
MNPFHTKLGDYKPNDELLQSTNRIKNQRDFIVERINKMQDARKRVSQTVYDKVKRDYDLQLETISQLFEEKKEVISKEVKELYVRREKLTVEINRHKEILEEAEFRNFLGEFSETQFQEVQNYETKEIDKIETDLSRITQFIREHESLFDPQDLSPKVKAPTEPAQQNQEAPKPQQPVQQQVQQTAQPPVQQTTAPVSQPAEPPLEPTPITPDPVPEPTTPVAPQAKTVQPEPEPVLATPTAPEPATPEVENPVTVNQSPSESNDATHADIETGEYEALFDDDQDNKKETLGDNKSAIDEIIGDYTQNQSEPTEAKAETKDEDEFEDYFSQDEVEETSFTQKKPLEDPIEEIPLETQEPQTATVAQSNATSPSDPQEQKTETNVTKPEPQEVGDSSISDILDSIKLDDDQPEVTSDQPLAEIESDQPASPSDSLEFYLTFIDDENGDNKEYPIKDNISIGRSSSNDITLKAPKVSRQHAAINMYNNQYIIIDLKSSNGVFVNGTKIDESILNPGDEISVGGYKFIFDKK